MTSIISEFEDWLNNTVVYKPYVGKDKYSEPTYGASDNIDCYVEGDVERIMNYQNEEVISTEKVYIVGKEISVNDYIELDDRYRPIQKVTKYYNEIGDLDYVVVFL